MQLRFNNTQFPSVVQGTEKQTLSKHRVPFYLLPTFVSGANRMGNQTSKKTAPKGCFPILLPWLLGNELRFYF